MLNTTTTASEEQQRMIDSLAEMVPQNCMALDVLVAQQGGTYALMGEECFLC